MPLSAKPLVIAYGDAELPELQSQSQEFFKQRGDAGKPGRLLVQLRLESLHHPHGLVEFRKCACPGGESVGSRARQGCVRQQLGRSYFMLIAGRAP